MLYILNPEANIMKKTLLVLISLLCVFSITACSVKEAASGVDFSEIFGGDKPVSLEIGCGKGGFVCVQG